MSSNMKSSGLRKQKAREITANRDLGVSFSILNCAEYDIDWRKALRYTLKMGFKRFRLMSYWSYYERKPGETDFSELDEQIEMIAAAGGRVTLAIGMRQPRWPETHLPEWTEDLSSAEVVESYMEFHRKVIQRYKDNTAVESWQLENEFWLRSFGRHFDFSRERLVREFNLIRELNPDKPIIMSTARLTSLPLRKPTPDLYATSVYRIIYDGDKQSYMFTEIKPWMYRFKRFLIRLVKRRDYIIHELQTEPWGPEANWKMSQPEQRKSMNEEEIQKAVRYARETGIHYADAWGAEWWYWYYVSYDDDILTTTVAGLIEPTTA